jgi:hypothetical protein
VVPRTRSTAVRWILEEAESEDDGPVSLDSTFDAPRGSAPSESPPRLHALHGFVLCTSGERSCGASPSPTSSSPTRPRNPQIPLISIFWMRSDAGDFTLKAVAEGEIDRYF